MKPSEIMKLWEANTDAVKKEANLRTASNPTQSCGKCIHWAPNGKCHVLSKKAGFSIITRKDQTCKYFKKKG